MATPGLAVVKEVAAIAGIRRELEVRTAGRVTVYGQMCVSGMKAAGEVGAMKHVCSQHVDNGSRYGCQDAEDAHYH